MMTWMKDFTTKAKTNWRRFNNATAKEGLMALCAKMTAADGKVEPQEKQKVARVIQTNELLQDFDHAELAALFNKYVDDAQDDIAGLHLDQKIGRLKGTETADYALKVALVIANSDVADVEKAVAVNAARLMGLSPADYGL
jgi:tellurite resistance protein TerB